MYRNSHPLQNLKPGSQIQTVLCSLSRNIVKKLEVCPHVRWWNFCSNLVGILQQIYPQNTDSCRICTTHICSFSKCSEH